MELPFEVRRVPGKGLGIFATINIKPGEVVESCPIIVLNSKERKDANKTILAYYIYPYRSERTGAVVLGYGSLINHSYSANCNWDLDFQSNKMVFKAVLPVRKGEEITVNYNGEHDDKTALIGFDFE